MIEFGEYSIAWAIYSVAAFGVLLVVARALRGVSWRYPKHVVWLSIATLLLTPATAVESYWAPAWIIGSFEGLFGDEERALAAAHIMLSILVVLLVVYTVISLFMYLRYRQQRSSSES